jgi:voltage-gated potassium channel Kch
VKASTLSFAGAAGCIAAGAAAFSLTQHVGAVTGLYWAVTTATTVGYGDVAARNTTGQLISVLVMLTTIPLLANAMSHAHLRRQKKQTDGQLAEHREGIRDDLHKITGKRVA